ncbi:restriction endonuclease subunit S [Clostridium perfringens]|uniref:restriction endonuclease subunit S n=1 Tax=Clostridium perfringens TaxID=1502 RepID=UPI0024BCDE58|nr:restriction endonuclease subunit S [Clostridium perfringens]MDM0890364.1 restriction endonuclease subunit S [Clostridium perfringens]MDU1474397.1 restriction endonuclease subunit S [Clostridium perfringens]
MSFKEKNWQLYKLKDIIQFNPKESIKKKEIAKKIAMDKLEPFTRKVSGYEETEFTSGTKFRNGDTLLARITPCLENGKTAQVDILDENEIGFGSTEYIVLREKLGITFNDYIYYLSISPEFRNMAIKSMTGSSGRQRVQKDVLEESEIILPILEEQKAIAKILSDLDEKIEVNNKINKNLEEMAQAIFKQWFVDFEFPNEEGKPYKSSGGEMVESELGMIPKGWKISSLIDIADYLNGLAMQKFKPSEDEKGLKVLKIKELRQGFTDESSDLCSENIKQEYIINNGDVIFSWSGTLLVDLWGADKCGLNQHLFKVTSNKYYKWYYYYWTKFHLNKFISIAKDKATTMGHIKRSNLSESLVFVPNDSTLKLMNKVMNPIITQVINNKVENKRLEKLRDTLLPKLMSGEIRVPLETNEN